MPSAAKNLPRHLLNLAWLVVFIAAQTVFSQTTGPAVQRKDISVAQAGRWRVEYNLAAGTADIFCNGKILIPRAYAAVKLPETVTSRDYQARKVLRRKISDGFGRGVEFSVESANGTADKMIQTFWLYEKLDYLLADVKIQRQAGASSNFMSPLTTEAAMAFPADGDNRALSATNAAICAFPKLNASAPSPRRSKY